MEEFSSHSNEDDDTDKPESDKKKKKRAGALGAFAVEPKADKVPSEKSEKSKTEDFWSVKREDKSDKMDKEKADKEVPLEELSEEEIAGVRRQAAEAKLAVLHSERLDEISSEEALGDQLVMDFLEQVAHEGQLPDAAIEATLAKVGVTPEEIAAVDGEPITEEEPALEESPEESPAEAEPDEPPREFNGPEAEMFVRVPESTDSSESEEAEEPSVATPSGGGTTPPPPPPRPTAQAGGNTGPPQPRRPIGVAPIGGYNPAFHDAMPGRLRAEYLPAFGEPGMIDAALAGGVGGMVGYLIGRRRGRIKTEKKLVPIQKKLEKQVKNLQWELQSQETKLRRVAAKRVQSRGPAALERARPPHEQPQSVAAEGVETPVRQAAPEAHQLHGERYASERLGRLVVIAEAAPTTAREAREEEPRRVETLPRMPEKPTEPVLKVEKNIDTMARAELLALSDKIIIDGASLRQIYETRLVGERGLRRLVSEHLSGGNVKKVLRQEIVEREIDFERDPALRDTTSPTSGGGGTSGTDGSGGNSAQTNLQAMLDRSDPPTDGTGEEAAYHKARTTYDTQRQARQQQKRRAIDVSMGLVITALVIMLIVLLLTH